jgi:hypothetical protein
VSHLLVSVPPDARGDPVLRCCAGELVARARQFAWVGYLSTTGVYGDHGGGWVDESTPRAPLTERARRRVEAENGWLALARDHGLAVHVFRLAGIYGPDRNQLAAVLDGSARRIVKPGQVFSRIHVDDVAGVLQASIARPDPGRAYNVADDEPAPPQDVVAYAARLLGRPVPPEVPFEAASFRPWPAASMASPSGCRTADQAGTGLPAHLPDLPRGPQGVPCSCLVRHDRQPFRQRHEGGEIPRGGQPVIAAFHESELHVIAAERLIELEAVLPGDVRVVFAVHDVHRAGNLDPLPRIRWRRPSSISARVIG